ncbi:homogentisate 1,2-dioxygenase [Reyranella sp. CPCC 100927]|uniref:homogentisate 1,2-dioxygenase n=1 Tax=Reyranella sp. CPCC 100927 TaxID=2599616 RepID=UPI0011B69928|nr:homogentisate 1,2-dioxygenase [Reyranella sp. CPCC 100927]TWS96359.1 homogentisate 1,2-dioxygenase [Reyranella sp. CPCC 100927]
MPVSDIADGRTAAASSTTTLVYQTGFGNEFATEALPGALPVGRNSPQKPAYGLYTELLSGTSFLAPRAVGRRSWLYRIRPSAKNAPFRPYATHLWRSGPVEEVPMPADRLRWNRFAMPKAGTDFIDGLATLAVNGDAGMQAGIAVHVYRANASMTDRFFANHDGEMLFVPQTGRLRLASEMGIVEAKPGEIAVLPRGVRCRIDLPDGPSYGFVGENYGMHLRLPDLGPLGSNGLANPRDFETPVAAYEDRTGDFEMVVKTGGRLWVCDVDRSPLDVVAWHGTLAPYRYDLARFNTMGTVSYDHPDPSIYTVLTAPSDTPGWANIDFVIFPPRWMVAEDTFRPPWFHRNVMSEFMGLIHGQYDARAEGFTPGGTSLHNAFTAHGPDASTFETASNAALAPHKIDNTLAFMFETRYPLKPTRFAMESPERQLEYYKTWDSLTARFKA